MLNQPCWDVNYSLWPSLSFNFGKPKLKFETCKNDPVRDRRLRTLTGIWAEWHFWALHAYWKLTVISMDGKSKLTAANSSTTKQKYDACRLLTGQRLSAVEIDNEAARTTLRFDLGAGLIIRRPTSKTKELWSLAEPNGYYLSINGDGTYDHKPGSGIDGRPSVQNRPISNSVKIP